MYVIFAGFWAFAAAVSVDDVRTRACEWEHPLPGGVAVSAGASESSGGALCNALKNRVSCYPATNCEGGVLYGIFLRDWVLTCPELLVSEYDAQCGSYIESSNMSTATVAIIVSVSVVAGILVVGLGICLVLYFTRHLRSPTSALPSPTPYHTNYARGMQQRAWYPTNAAQMQMRGGF